MWWGLEDRTVGPTAKKLPAVEMGGSAVGVLEQQTAELRRMLGASWWCNWVAMDRLVDDYGEMQLEGVDGSWLAVMGAADKAIDEMRCHPGLWRHMRESGLAVVCSTRNMKVARVYWRTHHCGLRRSWGS